MPKLLQITFCNPNKPTAEQKAAAWERAHKIASFPGLLWKIWIADEQADPPILGGTYLFADEASAKAYLASPIPDDIRDMPKFSAQIFGVEEDFSAVTRAPLSMSNNTSG